MALDYTVDTMVARIRRNLQLRTNNQKLTTAEIVELADECIQSDLFPALMQDRNDYASASAVVQLVSGTSAYRTPGAANSNTIMQVQVIELDAARTRQRQWDLRRITIGDLAMFTGMDGTIPAAYAIAGDTIEVRPIPDASMAATYVLLVHYETRPSRLCLAAECGLIDAVTDTAPTLDLTLHSVLSATGMVTGSIVDIVPGVPPLGPYITGSVIVDTTNDPVITVANGYVITSTQLAAQIVPGGYLVPNGTTCVFPMPEAWWPICILAASSACAAALGDDGSAVKYGTLADAKKALVLQAQANRVRKQPLPAFNRNSPLRSGARSRWRGGLP